MGEGERLGLDEVGVLDFAAGVWRERRYMRVHISHSFTFQRIHRIHPVSTTSNSAYIHPA